MEEERRCGRTCALPLESPLSSIAWKASLLISGVVRSELELLVPAVTAERRAQPPRDEEPSTRRRRAQPAQGLPRIRARAKKEEREGESARARNRIPFFKKKQPNNQVFAVAGRNRLLFCETGRNRLLAAGFWAKRSQKANHRRKSPSPSTYMVVYGSTGRHSARAHFL